MERIKDTVVKARPQTAGAEDNEGGVYGGEYGKFKDLESLLKAYDSLEAEFTRRSQRLKELERGAADKTNRTDSESSPPPGGSGENTEEEFVKLYPRAKEFSQQIAAARHKQGLNGAKDMERVYIGILEENLKSSENKFSEEKFLLEKVRENPAVLDKILKSYLKELVNSKPKAAFGGGNALATPPKRPKNLTEASAMTELYLSNKGERKW